MLKSPPIQLGMKMLLYSSLLFGSMLLQTGSASAEEKTEFTMGGFSDSQYFFVHQADGFDKTKADANVTMPQNFFVSMAKLKLGFERNALNGMRYGASAQLWTNPSPAPNNKVYLGQKVGIYTESKFGKLELGSLDGAENTLKASAYSVAKGAGGLDSSLWMKVAPFKTMYNNKLNVPGAHIFLLEPYLSYSTEHNKSGVKLTYYSKRYGGWSFGVSFIPHPEVSGTVYEMLNGKFKLYRNVLEGGARYEKKIGADIKLVGSLTSQMGKSLDLSIANPRNGSDTPIVEPRNDLRTVEVGSMLTYKNVSIAASYADWFKTGSLKNIDPQFGLKKGASWMTLGTSYVYNKFGASLNYMQSKRGGNASGFEYNLWKESSTNFNSVNPGLKHNTTNVVIAALQYQILPGLLPYIEYSTFNLKTPIKNLKTNKGHLFVTGMALRF